VKVKQKKILLENQKSNNPVRFIRVVCVEHAGVTRVINSFLPHGENGDCFAV